MGEVTHPYATRETGFVLERNGARLHVERWGGHETPRAMVIVEASGERAEMVLTFGEARAVLDALAEFLDVHQVREPRRYASLDDLVQSAQGRVPESAREDVAAAAREHMHLWPQQRPADA